MLIKSRKRGFTAIELMVVVAIIGVLVALMVPAVGGVRESARRSQCQDNLHNVIIALHNYEGAHKGLPPGFIHQVPNHSNYGWQAMFLPYVEQKPLYDLIRPGNPGLADALTNAKKAKALQSKVEFLVCPSEKGAATNSHFVAFDSDDEPHELALSSYVGNNGSDLIPREWSTKDHRLHVRPPKGIFGPNVSTRFGSITDGTSNTIGVGERTWTLKNGKDVNKCGAAIYAGVIGDGKVINQRAILGSSAFGVNSVKGDEKTVHCESGISSAHPGGAQVGVLDGKVSFLSEEINQELLDNLFVKDDGNAAYLP
ncbi:MAG: DUF1559 domain-containing protein [Planctomycetaceae bacterium]